MKNIINLAKSLLKDEDTACVVYLDQSVYLRFEPAVTQNQLTMHYRRCSFKDPRQFESLKKYFYQTLNFLFGKVVENTDSYILGTVDMPSDEDNFESKCAPSGVERFAMGDSKIRSALDDIGIFYYGEQNMNENLFESVFAKSHLNENTVSKVTNVAELLEATKEGMNAVLIFNADMMLYSYINSSGRIVPIYYNLDLGGEDSPYFEALKDHLKNLTLRNDGKILSNDNASNFVAEFSKGHILESSNIFEDLALEYSSGDRQYLTKSDLENINLNANDLANWS